MHLTVTEGEIKYMRRANWDRGYSTAYIKIGSYTFKRTYTYLLTPWSRVLLEKLTGSAASQEISRI